MSSPNAVSGGFFVLTHGHVCRPTQHLDPSRPQRESQRLRSCARSRPLQMRRKQQKGRNKHSVVGASSSSFQPHPSSTPPLLPPPLVVLLQSHQGRGLPFTPPLSRRIVFLEHLPPFLHLDNGFHVVLDYSAVLLFNVQGHVETIEVLRPTGLQPELSQLGKAEITF